MATVSSSALAACLSRPPVKKQQQSPCSCSCACSIGSPSRGSVGFGSSSSSRIRKRISAMSQPQSKVEEKHGILIEKKPSEEKLKQLGVKSWPKWGCAPSSFPWTYDAKETCYLLEGLVKVSPANSGATVTIEAGDLVVFPKGMECVWEVLVAVDKHYKFD